MRAFRKIAVPISCVAVIWGAAFVWQAHRTRVNELKFAEEAKAFRLRAEHGDAEAQANLGKRYSHGQGVPQDFAEAIRWYHKAADQGDAKGEDGLAYMYYHGRGVPQDYGEAIRWYHKAADQGDAKGEDGLAYMYYYGRGVPQDRAEAERWYHKAADQGDEYAQRALGLRGQGLSIRLALTVSGMFLACWIALKDVILPPPGIYPEPQPRALTVGGLCGLAYIGLSLYGAFGVFHSVLTANAFRFVKVLVGGLTMGLLITLFGAKSAKVVLWVSAILLIGSNLIVILHHERFATPIRGFSVVNGSLIGIGLPLAIFVWRAGKATTRKQTDAEPST